MTPTQDWSNLSLMGLFSLEVKTQVNELNQHLLSLETSCEPLDDRSRLDSLMRAAHSIKGAARIVQIEAAVKISHALEDCFIAAQQGKLAIRGDQVDVLLTGADLLLRLGSIEESALATQLPAYETDTNTVVLAIEALVTAAGKASQLNERATERATEFVDLDASAIAEPPLREIAELPDSPKLPADESAQRMIRMSADNLSRLMGLVGESLVESNWLQPFSQSLLQLKRQQQAIIAQLEKQPLGIDLDKAIQGMQDCHTLLSDQLSDLDLFSQRFGQLSDRLYREVIAGHMCAFEAGTQGYSRLVRDLSRSLNKQVVLKITGLTTQVDRDILTKLDTPITHLLTNAVVHGIELPEVRIAKGKPAEGTVYLRAAHRSGMLVVSVEDDGAGIDYVELRQKIADKGLITAEIADQLNELELSEFLFLPGFSTAAQVDEVAGRGYGLDLVRTMAQSVGGSLQAISPAVGKEGSMSGTRFQFQLPLTLSVVRSLLFEVASEPYAMSLSRIARVVKLRAEQIRTSENRPYFSLMGREINGSSGSGGENISLVSAHQLLALSEGVVPAEPFSVIVIGEPGNRYGLCVDRLLEEQDLVVRPLDPRLGKVPNISAAALTEKGAPILILDVADVLRSAEKVATQNISSLKEAAVDAQQSAKVADKNSGQLAPKRVLVVDDSMTVRAMEKKLLKNRGYAVDVAVDGAEGWNAARMNPYDLVITDVDMPRMSGIELIGKLRSHAATKKLPVIVVSYKDRAEDQLAGLNAGANYYLTKSSFHDDGLINAVVDLIGKPA